MVHATVGIPAPTRADRRDGPGGVRLPRASGAAGGARGSRSSPRTAESADAEAGQRPHRRAANAKSARGRSRRCSLMSIPITRSIPWPYGCLRAYADQPFGRRRAAGRDRAELRAPARGSFRSPTPRAHPLSGGRLHLMPQIRKTGFVRVAHRSDWSAVDGKDPCDRNPEPTQPWGGAWLAQAPGSLREFLESHRWKNPASLHRHRNFC
jgi:hypothetical protein